MRARLGLIGAILPALVAAPAAAAQPAPVAAPTAAAEPSVLAGRSTALIPVLEGAGDPAQVFAPSFLAQIPAAQVRAVAATLRTQFGAPKAVLRIEGESAAGGTVVVDYERGIVQFRIALAAEPPHLITGLLVAASELKGDSAAAIIQELKGLPGQVSVSVAALGPPPPSEAAAVSVQPERPLAVGSAFKLFILAELVREVKAKERRWSDVVALDRHSLPSGLLQAWPLGAPMTVHSLAALMISQSDNSAADTLLHLVGREKVEHLLPMLGVKAPERDRPLLSTLEAFALKADPDSVRRWAAADEAKRRAMLAPLANSRVDVAALAGGPRAIDSIEWYGSTGDLVRTMDWLRASGDPAALAILAINRGIAPAQAAQFSYVGYKGGSEAGVLSLTWLLRRNDGGWRTVSAIWNDPAAPLDEARFITLIGRLVALQR